jgi:S1-C subfamily serine protease
VILRYDGDAIFTKTDLLDASQSDVTGPTVEVDVLRNGEAMTVSVPPGPVGFPLEAIKQPPGN